MSICMDDIVAAGNPDYELLTFSWNLIDVCQYECSYCSAIHFNQHTFFKSPESRNAWKNVIKKLSLKSINKI